MHTKVNLDAGTLTERKGGEEKKKSKMEMNSHLCVQIKEAELFNFLPLLDLQKRREEKVGEIWMDESV